MLYQRTHFLIQPSLVFLLQTDNSSQLQPSEGSGTSEEVVRSFVLTCLRSHAGFSSENPQELNQIASLAIRFRNEQRDNSLLLPRTNRLDSTIEVELQTRVHNAAVAITPVGSPIATSASASIPEASNVSNKEASNNTFEHNVSKTKTRRKQSQTTRQIPANRSEQGYKCRCGRLLVHVGLCPYNSTEEARRLVDAKLCPYNSTEEERRKVLGGIVTQPIPSVSEADIQRLIEKQAAGDAARQEQDEGCGIYMCGNCGQVARPHVCPFERCPVCGRWRKDHNNNTFCPNKSKKSK